MRKLVFLFALLGLVLGSSTAWAAKAGNAQVFRPSPHSLDLFQVEGARMNWWGAKPFDLKTLNAWAVFNYAGFGGSKTTALALDSVGTLDVLASVALFSRLSIGLDLPLHVTQSGKGTNGGFAMGDLRLGLKGSLLAPRKYGLGLATAVDVIAPTGGDNVLTSERGLVVVPKLIVEGVSRYAQFALNLAYLARLEKNPLTKEREDELEARAGLGIPFGGPTVMGILETAFASVPKYFFEDACTRLEIDAGVRVRLASGLTFSGGGGAGALKGFGDPTYRVFFGVGWQPVSFQPATPPDADLDGFCDSCDRCPAEPEDFDGFQDDDGCPDLDNDRDGLLDPSDRCPNEPEDKDGFQDDDGCPDPDNDGDGLLDAQDQCPLEPEDKDGFQDDDGCPDYDNDRDGVLDTADKCPMEPETMNGFEDADGCPDTLPMVYMTTDKIVITQKIFFQKGKDIILPKSYPVLEAVAKILVEHPEILKIRVEGHTSSEGDRKFNVTLSDKRAKAIVKFLVGKKVDKARLEGVGYGPDKPLVPMPEPNEEEREKNRRVEFTILDQK